MKQLTQKQINRALAPTFAQKARMGANIILIGTASWLFYHAMLPGQAFAQDSKKAKAQSEQAAPPQEQLKPNERRIPIEPVDPVADSAAIRQLNERYRQREINAGNQNPAPLKIIGKARTFPVELPDTKKISSGPNDQITLFLLGPAPLNTYDAYKIQKPELFVKGSFWCTFTINGYIFAATFN